MTISRGQMPRQLYGLGGLLKSITKGVKSAVKGVAKTVKKNPVLGLAALNFAPMLLPGGKPFLGLGGFSLPEFLTSGGKAKSMLKVGAAGGLLTGLLAEAEQGDENALALTRNIPALKGYLFENYKNLGYTDSQAQELTDKDTAEYTSGMGGYAEGGRIMKAIGGDTAEDNAMQASGIMGLPLNENPAGVKELDLRETGGFIPPVGVKEKADDIPAMLSNNEFVFTADAVRGMGDGNVNVGAQRMYDMMKKLENGGRV